MHLGGKKVKFTLRFIQIHIVIGLRAQYSIKSKDKLYKYVRSEITHSEDFHSKKTLLNQSQT